VFCMVVPSCVQLPNVVLAAHWSSGKFQRESRHVLWSPKHSCCISFAVLAVVHWGECYCWL